MLAYIYEAKKDWQHAYQYQKLSDRFELENINLQQRQILTEYTALFDNRRIENEKNQLALQNTHLQMIQMRTKEQLMATERGRNLLLLFNTRLELNNKRLALQRQKSDNERQRLETEKQRSDVKHKTELLYISEQKAVANRRLAVALIFILAILVISFVLYVVIRYRASRRLQLEMQEVKNARNEAETARREAELARNEAIEANQTKTRFLQNMSHEIRTPLNAIVGFTDMLADSSVTINEEERKQFINLIHNNSDSLTNMVNDILDTSLLDSGTYHMILNEVSADAMCRTTIASLSSPLSPSVQLRYLPPTTGDVLIRTDELRVRQLLTNFLTNACKYTDQGSITLTFCCEGDDIIFSVTDTGCGIAPENANRIFQRFEKLNNFKQGTGLGLNICKQIAGLLHGEVKLDTDYRQGARFLFIQPRNL